MRGWSRGREEGKEQGRPGLVDGGQQGGGVLRRTSDEEEAGSRGPRLLLLRFCAALKNRKGVGEENSGWVGGI